MSTVTIHPGNPSSARTTTRRGATGRPATQRPATQRPMPLRPGSVRPVQPVPPVRVAARSYPADRSLPTVVRPVAPSPVQVRPVQMRRVRVRPAPTVRLTRRGQVVIVTLLLGIVLAGFTAFGSWSAASSHPGTPVPTHTVEVAPGDTLWGIAADVAKPGRIREMVQQIEQLNAMSSSGVRVGQQIAVPVG